MKGAFPMTNLKGLPDCVEMPADPIAFLIEAGLGYTDAQGHLWMRSGTTPISARVRGPTPTNDPASIDHRSTPATERELVSIKTLSTLIATPEKTIRDWVYRSRKNPTFDPLPYHKLGGLVRFRLKDVHAWIDRRRIRPVPMVK
jgi:hypothetical protein